VKGLDRLEQLVPVVEDLGRRHAGYGVENRHYDTSAKRCCGPLRWDSARRSPPMSRKRGRRSMEFSRRR
jgi:hypothetical protein